jgi:hypothetical protein
MVRMVRRFLLRRRFRSLLVQLRLDAAAEAQRQRQEQVPPNRGAEAGGREGVSPWRFWSRGVSGPMAYLRRGGP